MKNRIILITGASHGIGRELAIQLSDSNTVLAVARDQTALNTLSRTHGVIALATDLSDREQVKALGQLIISQWPDLSVIFNNAALQQPLNILNNPHAIEFDSELEVNLHSPIRLCLDLIPLLSRQKESRIINTTSILAMSAKQSTPVYNASKAGLRLFTHALRYQLRDTSIKVCEIIPPVTATALGNVIEKQSAPSPQWVARQILNKLSAGKTDITIGKARIGILLNRWFPSLLQKILIKG